MNLVNLVPSSTVVGTLKGYDQLLNLVMDDLEETLRGENPLLANPVYVFSVLKFSVVFRRSRNWIAFVSTANEGSGTRSSTRNKLGRSESGRRVSSPSSIPHSDPSLTLPPHFISSEEIANPFAA